MNYHANRLILENFYNQFNLKNHFEKDNKYIEKAFKEIHDLWLYNFNQIEIVKYLMIAEAPLWGKEKKYIYNPDINNSQFFYRSDLSDVINKPIPDKLSFIKTCNKIGLLIIDISPFPLNPKETCINYRDISAVHYRNLVSLTIPVFFEEMIKEIKIKKSDDIKTFFRYSRVKNNFNDIISKVLIDNRIIRHKYEIDEISQNGGGIDKNKLKLIINN